MLIITKSKIYMVVAKIGIKSRRNHLSIQSLTHNTIAVQLFDSNLGKRYIKNIDNSCTAIVLCADDWIALIYMQQMGAL